MYIYLYIYVYVCIYPDAQHSQSCMMSEGWYVIYRSIDIGFRVNP